MKIRFPHVVLGLVAILGVAAMAADQPPTPPTWWQQYGITLGQPANLDPGLNQSSNSTTVTVGQLKDWAAGARDYLDTALVLDDRAGQDISDAISSLDDSDISVPATVEQLHSVMQPIYDRMIAAGYDTKASLQANGAGADWAFRYPWADAPVGPDDPAFDANAYVAWQLQQVAPADLSQAELALSFDVNSMTLTKILLPNGSSGVGGRRSSLEGGADAKNGTEEDDASKNAAGINATNSAKNTFEASLSAGSESSELALVVLTPLE